MVKEDYEEQCYSDVINGKELDPKSSVMKTGEWTSFSILHVDLVVGVPYKSCYLRGSIQILGTLTSGFKGQGVK